MRDAIVASFRGHSADENHLPAYEATQSLYGISRALLLTTNYISEGRVRYKNFDYRKSNIILTSYRQGSFDFVFEYHIIDEVLLPLSIGITGAFIKDFITTIFHRATGGHGENKIDELERNGELNPGDLAALCDAIEPPLRSAHKSINHGAQQIFIISGDNNIITFNTDTKRYVNTSRRDDEVNVKVFSVGSFNANSRYGRAFDYEEGRTVPFSLSSEADPLTFRYIMESMTNYVRHISTRLETNSDVAFKYHAIRSVDGKVKNMIVHRARNNINDLEN